MREVLLTTLLALSLLPAALAGPDGRATATVVSIGDGDTIRVIEGGKRITVRLACIDAPELAQRPDGEQAHRYLQSRLKVGSKVQLIPLTVDRYGRTVAEVVGEVNLNLAMVEDGMAFAYRKFLGHCDEKAYLDAEFRANRRRYGVWKVPGGITRPWDFRRSRRSSGSAADSRSVPGGRRYRCSEIGSYALAQELLRQGHSYLDGNGDGEACESLRP